MHSYSQINLWKCNNRDGLFPKAGVSGTAGTVLAVPLFEAEIMWERRFDRRG